VLSEHATYGTVFISASLFALFPAHLLTPLLIGGRFVIAAIKLCSRYQSTQGDIYEVT
jgi:hypothetical protein